MTENTDWNRSARSAANVITACYNNGGSSCDVTCVSRHKTMVVNIVTCTSLLLLRKLQMLRKLLSHQ